MSDPTPSSPGRDGDGSVWTKIRRNKFLREMRRSANVSRACDAAGVSRGDAVALRAADEVFRTAWDDAELGAFDDLEEEVLRRARDGVDKPVYFGGKVCGTTRSYNDALALEILKQRRDRLNDQRGGEPDADAQGHSSSVELIEERLRQFEAAHSGNED
jgi:hypothetical protein